MKKIILLISLFYYSLLIIAQAPSGYYNSALGLSGDDARLALHNIIKNHNSVDYNNLWGYFNNTDVSNGAIIDIYSSYSFTFSTDQCGQYSAEGDCYNREHTVPQDWFNSALPMYSDLFHIYPTDGYVNGQRSNLPYGEVSSPTYTSTNGCKKGSNTYPGYSGTVFEVTDTYKGDIARTYFYMATRYMDVISSWSGESFQGDNLKQWTIDMMLQWHNNDPVSQKEIDRNNTIYAIQGNRNPYIDNPGWAERVFVWPTSISEQENLSTSMWYYNNTIYFRNNNKSETSQVNIYNILGELVNSYQINDGDNELKTDLNSGIYIATYKNVSLKMVIL